MQVDSEFLETLRDGLLEQGKSQTDLAHFLGKSRSWATRLLSGELHTMNDLDAALLEGWLKLQPGDLSLDALSLPRKRLVRAFLTLLPTWSDVEVLRALRSDPRANCETGDNDEDSA